MRGLIKSLSIGLILFLSLITINAGGQTPRIKKTTVITFNYWGVNSDGSPNLQDCDTTIYDYEKRIKLRKNKIVPLGSIYLPAKIITVDSSKNYLHKIEYQSDSSIYETFFTKYQDSSITFTLKKKDTIRKEINYYKHAQLYRTLTFQFGNQYFYFEDLRIYRNNFLFKKRIETINYCKDKDCSETKKYAHNKITGTNRIYGFNAYKKEWFVENRKKYNRKGALIKETAQFYHDYFKRYFKTRTHYKYNRQGYLVLEETYNYAHGIEKRVVHLYEFY